jgi:hypothetical protein
MAMDYKTRFVLVTTMTALMVLMVTLIATLLNIGLRHDFLFQWLKAYLVGWPIAALTGFFFMPTARRITDRILILLGGAA